MSTSTYDVVGVGIGPFNLGLAALGSTHPELRMKFFDRQPRFDWHPGMMIEGTTLQVSFLADLVTGADPTNRFSFLAFMKAQGRLYRFAIRENYFLTREQYNVYCRWAASQLPVQWSTDVSSVSFDAERDAYTVETRNLETGEVEVCTARHVVLGVGSGPCVPGCVPTPLPEGVIHSASYMAQRAQLLKKKSLLVVGSGQSAAEVFLDLLTRKQDETALTWITRSERFFPMDYTKFALEMASPDYIDFFHKLNPTQRKGLLESQDDLYKGISADLIGRIYDELYDRSLLGHQDNVRLSAGSELTGLDPSEDGGHTAHFRHLRLEQRYDQQVDGVVLATGYRNTSPACLKPLFPGTPGNTFAQEPLPVRRNYVLSCAGGRVFVQNAEALTHGFGASDLSLGAYRNSVILNQILGRPHYIVEQGSAFQDFGIPSSAEPVLAAPVPLRRTAGGQDGR